MIVKYAFRNLIRLPWRTFLYISVAFFITLSVTAALFVCGAVQNAKSETEEGYVFVASLVPKKKDALSLRDIGYCIDKTEVLAYNVSMSECEGVILGGNYLFNLPENIAFEDAPLGWQDTLGCRMVAVENLGLCYSFFTGECTITEGTGITQDGYMGEKAEAVIPWWFAEEHDVKVGDTITRRYYQGSKMTYTYHRTEVVGIYETRAYAPNKEDYPVYIPLAVAEFDYGNLTSKVTDEITIHRADFVLEGRDSFQNFVLTAKENGLDFTNAGLVFNNRQYDVLLSELDDIYMIALIVAVTVFVAGMGMLIFFTVYLCTSRKSEWHLLASLGMQKRKIVAMIALELAVMLMFAVTIGFFVGRFSADAVCSYVETTISEKAAISEIIEKSGKSNTISDTEPLEKTIRLHISVSGVSYETTEMGIHYKTVLKDGEVGTVKRKYYDVGGDMKASQTAEQIPITIIGVDDVETLGIQVHEEYEVNTEYFIPVYVSASYDRSRLKNNMFLVKSYGKDDYVTIYRYSDMGISEAKNSHTQTLYIAGTYAENIYFSGNDILVSMEDYYKIQRHFSVTDEEFYFERMEIFSE